MDKNLWNAILKTLNKTPEQYQQEVKQRAIQLQQPEQIDYSNLTLDGAKDAKLNELYNEYNKAKWSQITSTLTGEDGEPIVFDYAKNNKDDYSSIINAFSIDPNKTENIIGSRSHGKFYITRDEAIQLSQDCAEHESNMYMKFRGLKDQVLVAADIDTIKQVVWE